MDENLEDIIERALQESREKLYDDPEWTELNYFHITSLIQALSHGILSSYSYYQNYQLPPHFEKVMNESITKLTPYFKNDCVQKMCLIKIEGILKKILFSIPEYHEWNTYGGSEILCRGDFINDIPTERCFIDLDVPPRNAAIYLRNMVRDNKEFDKKYGKLPGDNS